MEGNNSLQINEKWMALALDLARKAATAGEVPVGALVVCEGNVVSRAYNYKERGNCATYHAEILAIQQASAKLGRWRLSGCDLYVTLEPCVMCAGALVGARLDRVFYGATDSKAGAVESLFYILDDKRLNHSPEVQGGVLAKECGSLLKEFFHKRRK